MLKKGNNLSSTINLVCVLILSVLVIFVPGAKDTIFAMLTNSEDFQPISVNFGDFDIKWDINFELPSLQFDAELNPILNISAPFIIVALIAALLAIALSYRFYWTTLILTILSGALGLYFSFQATGIYGTLLSNGNTPWEAAGSCFWILFFLYLFVMAVGLLNLISTILILWLDPVPRYIFGILIAIIVATLGSFIVSGLCYLVLGTGWSGGIYLFLAIAALIALAGEFANNYIHSDTDTGSSSSNIDDYDYEYNIEDYE